MLCCLARDLVVSPLRLSQVLALRTQVDPIDNLGQRLLLVRRSAPPGSPLCEQVLDVWKTLKPKKRRDAG
eukprot:4241693-Pyramimonas_sp.AAC.1